MLEKNLKNRKKKKRKKGHMYRETDNGTILISKYLRGE